MGCQQSWRQFYLLLWRNALVRWRTGSIKIGITIPVLHFLEIAWPVVLYAVLAALRQKFPPEERPEAKFRGYALPSAGVLPFMQTMMCDFDYQTSEDSDRSADMPTFPNAKINQLYSVLDDIGTWNATWTEVCDTIHELSDQVGCLQHIGDLRGEGCYQPDSDLVPVTCYLNNVSEFSDFLSMNLNLSQRVAEGILGAAIDTSKVNFFPGTNGRFRRQSDSGSGDSRDLLSFLQEMASNSAFLKNLFCNTSDQAFEIFHFSGISEHEVKQEVCQLSDQQWQELAQEVQRQTASDCKPVEVAQSVSDVLNLQRLLSGSDLTDLIDTFREEEWTRGGSGYGPDPPLSGGCLDLSAYTSYFCGTLDTRTNYLIYKILWEFCYGEYNDHRRKRSDERQQYSMKILYTPHNNATIPVIQKANRTFESIGQVIELARDIANCTEFFLENFPPDSSTVEGVREVLNQMITLREGGDVSGPEVIDVAPLLPEVNLDALLQARDLLDPSNPDNIWSIMATVNDVSNRISESLTRFNWDIYMPVKDEKELESLYSDTELQNELGLTYVVAGVVFDSVSPNSTSLSKHAQIRIRMDVTSVMDTSEYKDNIWYPSSENYGTRNGYINGFFIFVQDMLERAMAEEMVGHQIPSPGVYLQMMPYPCHKFDLFGITMLYILPVAMLFAWLFPVAMTTRAVVKEKEARLKEYMKIMGVGGGLLRLSWFLHSLVVLLLSVIGITVLLKVYDILPSTSWLVIFVFLTAYAVVMLSYSFLMSSFFNNANLAACVTALVYFLVLFANFAIIPKLSSLSPLVVGLCCLWAPLAFNLGATFLAQSELKQQGLTFDSISALTLEDDQLSFLAILIFLMIDTLLYTLVTWYIEGVFPGRYGVSKPWYFPFLPSYWLGGNFTGKMQRRFFRQGGRALTVVNMEEDEQELIGLTELGQKQEENMENYEEEPSGLPLGISIQNISKNYYTSLLPKIRKKIVGVKDFSLNFYEGQITALLGHNGAGKTTTMSLLTGLYEPSSGTAQIYGKNIRTNMDQIRLSLGMCPQHNILIEKLTVKEHLLFFGQLKGLSRAEAKRQLPLWLSKVDLTEHAHKYPKHLSGGMKRKLSILLAFVGNSKTIILDEPTSGVDPFSRQQIWDFLLRHRDGRTVMLSTHHMDEAEILGDRIAIMSKGSLLCCGSFEYLKHHFGGGHRLILVQRDRKQSISSHTLTATADIEEPSGLQEDRAVGIEGQSGIQEEQADSVEAATIETSDILDMTDIGESCITGFVQGIVAGASVIERRGQELHYRLPLLHARPRTLAHLFSQLEDQKKQLGVISFGMSSCTMEEIFVKLTEQELLEKNESSTSGESTPGSSLQSAQSQTSIDDGTPLPADTSSLDGVVDEEKLLPEDSTDDDPFATGLDSTVRLKFFRLWITQFYALFIKRLHYTKGKIAALTVQNVFPLVVITLALLVARYVQTIPDPPPLKLTPQHLFAKSRYNYVFTGGYYKNDTAPIIDSLFCPCGIGGSVLGSSTDKDSECFYDSSEQYSCSDYPQQLHVRCTCPVCEENVTSALNDDPSLCYNGTHTGSRVQNLTRPSAPTFYDHISSGDSSTSNSTQDDYPILHDYLLQSWGSFIEKRYGGLSFGHVKKEVSARIDEVNSGSTSLPFLATHSAAKVWYSLKGYHAMPSYLNTMNNAILRANLDRSADQSEYGITTISHPFATSDSSKIFSAINGNLSFLVNPLATVFALGFVVAGFVLMLIEERAGDIKHLQLVCGLNRVIYWLFTYTWDLVWFSAFAVVVLIFYLMFQDPYFSGSVEAILFLVILLCYGLAVIPWIYMLSSVFKSPATAYVLLFCLHFFVSLCLLIVDFVNWFSSEDDQDLLRQTFVWVPFPSYNLGRCMMYLTLDRPLAQAYAASQFTSASIPDPYADLKPFLVSLVVQSCVYSVVVVLIEVLPFLSKMCTCHWQCLWSLPPPPPNEDKLVSQERRRVLRGDYDEDLLVMNNLTKVYGGCGRARRRLAVNQLCLGMKKAECFGLLGVNGAGKTTTFRMLTGDTHASNGKATIGSHRTDAWCRGTHETIGYCPQVDALINPLTGRQHLTFYSRLRGIPAAQVKGVVNWALSKLDLEEHADKPVVTYSGGNRRKLSTAIALIAKPLLILLDEPTSGVDPRSRRFLWTVVKGLVSAGQSVVLTTHSMAECEALCSRVGIMVNGTLRCLGTPQQLKSTYGQGYRLKVRAQEGQVEALKDYVAQKLTAATLKEEHYNTILYQLPSVGLHLPQVYEIMEAAKESLDIEDYSLSQTTLDDVFVHFAKDQNEEVGLMSSSNHQANETMSDQHSDIEAQVPLES